MIGRVAAPAAAKAVASAPVQGIWGAQRGVVYMAPMAGLNRAVFDEAMKYGVRKEVVQWAKAHPTIVPYINGDKDMIHSIAETGWTRWLVGDGSSYLRIPHHANYQDEYDVKAYETSYGQWIFGSRLTNGEIGTCLVAKSATVIRTCNLGNTDENVTVNSYVGEMNYKSIGRKFTYNGQTFDYQAKRANSLQHDMALFALFDDNVVKYTATISPCKIAWYKVTNYNEFNLLPCRNPNGTDYGMVDVVSGQFYGNANTQGSFSVELTENT